MDDPAVSLGAAGWSLSALCDAPPVGSALLPVKLDQAEPMMSGVPAALTAVVAAARDGGGRRAR